MLLVANHKYDFEHILFSGDYENCIYFYNFMTTKERNWWENIWIQKENHIVPFPTVLLTLRQDNKEKNLCIV